MKYLLALTSLIATMLLAASSPRIQTADEEPIAFIGHGAFFDREGKQIELTLDFVARAQDWYRTKLVSSLSEEQKAEFAKIEDSLNADIKAEGQTQLVVQQRLLDWLVANSKTTESRTLGKLNALKYALQWEIPDQAGSKDFQPGEPFKLDPALENKLKSLEIRSSRLGLHQYRVTTNRGQAYINECAAAGVPIPPPIGQLDPAGLTGWKTQGFIPTGDQFIVGTPAEVRTFQSSSPAGMCIALPRYTNSTLATVQLDGVICLGQTTSNVCYWDNQMNGVGFPFASSTRVPIGVANTAINPAGQYQAGGAELEGGSGGVCTDCHAGENPYIVHPNSNLGTLLMGELRNTLPMFSGFRYDPLVAGSWPQNRLSHSPALVPPACRGCHVAGGFGGALPHLSSEISNYCSSVLANAINRTMPPSSPGSLASDPAIVAFRNWCSSSATSGPSNRGDPHLTTANGINYDFQAAGEFTALRNSATFFELQTRQTAVPTVITPLANAYTGLASCVSLNTAVALRLDKYRITYQPNAYQGSSAEALELRIDGTLVDLPKDGIDLGNGNLIRSADEKGALDITSWDGTRVIVTPNFWASQGYWYLNIDVLNTTAREGTMGYILPGDWLPLAPDGSSFGPAPANLDDRHILLNEKFAEAWRVTSSTSLFDYAIGATTDDFTDRLWPPKPGDPCTGNGTPPPVKPREPQRAKELCSVIKDETAFENCVFDLTALGDETIVEGYVRSLELREKALSGVP